ncbi:MAG: response regulator [Desulfobacteraceae bacterium]|nr:response regulator [Desulfobacteraceae bacterium]
MYRPLVLIADANEHIRLFLKRELEAEGFAVVFSNVHTEVLGILAADQKPDLVVLDANLPFIGGVSTLLSIRSRAPNLPVVIYTAYSEDSGNPEFSWADAVVEKIPDPGPLIRTIKLILARGKAPGPDKPLFFRETSGSGE